MAPCMSSNQAYDCNCVGGYINQTCESCGGNPRDVVECEPCGGTGSVKVLCPRGCTSNFASFADATLSIIAAVVAMEGITCKDEWETCPDCAGGRTAVDCTTCGGNGVVQSTASRLSGHPLTSIAATLPSIVGYGDFQSPSNLGH